MVFKRKVFDKPAPRWNLNFLLKTFRLIYVANTFGEFLSELFPVIRKHSTCESNHKKPK